VCDRLAIEKGMKWVRSPEFKKYFAQTFGFTRTGDFIRLDFGDERVQFTEKDKANISECQIIMDLKGFELFFNLLKHENKKIKKSKAKSK